MLVNFRLKLVKKYALLTKKKKKKKVGCIHRQSFPSERAWVSTTTEFGPFDVNKQPVFIHVNFIVLILW